MNRRRDNFFEFFTYNISLIRKNIILFGGLMFYMTKEWEKYGIFVILLGVSVVLYFSTASFLKWYYRTYEVSDGMISVSSGVLKKFHNDIPFNRVKSVNTSDTLTKRLFGISNLNIELVGGEQVQFVLKNTEIKQLKEEIFFSSFQEQSEVLENKIGKLSFFQHMLVAASNLLVLLTVFSVLGTIHSLFSKWYLDEAEKRLAGMFKTTFDALGTEEAAKYIFLLLATVSVFIAIAYFISVAASFLTYGNFSLSSDQRELRIRYGFLNKKEYTIPKEEVRSLKVSEPLFMKIFGYVKLEIENIGLGSDSGSTVILYPIIPKSEAAKLVEDHIPKFEILEATMKPDKRYLPIYLFRSLWFPILFIGFLTYINDNFIWGFIWVAYQGMKGFSKWKHAGLYFNDDFVSVCSSKQFGSRTMITPKKLIQSSGISQTWLMKKKGAYHYTFSVYSEQLNELYETKYLVEDKQQEFLDYLKK